MVESKEKPVLIWQTVLILLPVIVLLAVGSNSLRQDKILAHREATEHARRLAEDLTVETRTALDRAAAAVPSPSFEVDAEGNLLFPPPTKPFGPKPLLISSLSKDQARYWRTAQECGARTNEVAAALEAYKAFLLLRPPPEFVPHATYSMGLLLLAQGDLVAALETFKSLVEPGRDDAVTESGLPLQPLARLKILEVQSHLSLSNRVVSLDLLCSNLIHVPMPLTAALLREAERFANEPNLKAGLAEWQRRWRQQETARTMYAAARPLLAMRALPDSTNAATANSPPRVFWFSVESSDTNNANLSGGTSTGQRYDSTQAWLALRRPESSAGFWFLCWTEAQVAEQLSTVLINASAVPHYFGVEVQVAGKKIFPRTATNSVAQGDDPELLASSSRLEGGDEWLRADVYLTRPDLLYAFQRTRQLWFGSLIAISAVAAFVGLWANWRAFQRQQRLNELKSNFVSSVSHELRTPVASVQVLVDSLESGKVSGEWKRRQYLRLISQECRRLSALIENILDFSRIERGRKQFEFQATDLLALVERAVRVIEPYAAERRVSLSLAASDPAPPRALLDGRAIEQALLNLVDNAIKHSPEGRGVTVGLDWKNGTVIRGSAGDQVGCVSLWVEDRGAGIPAEEHTRIFERFYRRGSELRRETQGVGIGLSIVKHIVEAHDGRVLVRSAVGSGSRFTIELPLIVQPETQACERP